MQRGPALVLVLLCLFLGFTGLHAGTQTISWDPYPDDVIVSGFRIYYELGRADRERTRTGHLDVDASTTKVQIELPRRRRPWLLSIKVVALQGENCESDAEWQVYEVDSNPATPPMPVDPLIAPTELDPLAGIAEE